MKVSELRWVNDPPHMRARRHSQKLKWGNLLVKIVYRDDGLYADTYFYRTVDGATVFVEWTLLELAAHLTEMEPADATD